MDGLFIVLGAGGESPLSEGIHYAARSFEKCETWLRDNYQDVIIAAPYAPFSIGEHKGIISGWVFEIFPDGNLLSKKHWAEAVAFYAMQNDD